MSVDRRGLAFATERFVSFDGSTSARQRSTHPDRYRHLEALRDDEVRIVRGGGYSYVAASFGADATVQDFRAFDRVLAFDERDGTLECEAGVTLGKLYALTTARGWYLPVQPGYPEITIGGCVAADVHGKNHARDGTFRRHLTGLTLFHPRHGVLTLDATQNAELFELTCGGVGLTGNILTVRLQLARLPGRRLRLRRRRIARLEETPLLLEDAAEAATLLYTWHNLSSSSGNFGRGFMYSATFLDDHGPAARRDHDACSRIDASSRAWTRVRMFTGRTVRAFNLAYEALQASLPVEREVSLFDVMFPVARKVLYFHLFGRAGFRECQILVPRDAFGYVAGELRRVVLGARTPITLASCKLFRGRPAWLRFDGAGVCLALNVPRDRIGDAFARWLDDLVRDVKGLPNIMKDSRLASAVVRACYPDYDTFVDRLHRFDPGRLYRSEVSERLRL
jgi:decaprenylphospho-beta-D-ribofuranose 2-oxidase